MTQFSRPVRCADLLTSPEMRLRYPNGSDERPGTGNDEGAGSGFDLGSPRAYAERWFTTADGADEVQRWFRDHLEDLGWSVASRRRGFCTYSRDGDESVGVLVSGTTVRVHIEVEGRWPGGSSEYRPR